MAKRSFTVKAVIEVANHIGECDVEISAHGPDDFDIVSITNSNGDTREPDTLKQRNWEEVAFEVQQHFVCAAEAAADAREDR